LISDLRPSPIRIFGELEFWLSSIKVITLIGVFHSDPPVNLLSMLEF
jgi:amino acid permease